MNSSPSESSIIRSKSAPAKVCIVCRYRCYDDRYYAVFIVDLQSHGGDGFIPTAPTLLIERSSFETDYVFCVLNSTLYMFENGGLKFLTKRGRSVYTYGLSSFLDGDNNTISGSLRLKKNQLIRGRIMEGAKANPFATPTPDGKSILVFSSIIYYDPSDPRTNDLIHFELYFHGKKNPPRKLPPIHEYVLRKYRMHYVSFEIKAFAFLTESVFFIETEGLGNFSIDINSMDKGWQHQLTFAGERIPFIGRFFVIEDELCVTSSGAIYDIASKHGFDGHGLSPFPASSFGDDFELEGRGYRLLNILDDDFGGGSDLLVVQVQTGINDDNKYAHVLLDVCTCNLSKYREDKRIKEEGAQLCKDREDKMIEGDVAKLGKYRKDERTKKHGGQLGLYREDKRIEDERAQLESSIVKSWKFVLDGKLCRSFHPLCLLPIHQLTN